MRRVLTSALSCIGVISKGGAEMCFLKALAVCVIAILSGCASLRSSSLVSCTRESAHARGHQDGASGHKNRPSFAHFCTPDTRDLAVAAYREGFLSARPKRKVALTASKEPEPADAAEPESEEASRSLALDPLPSPSAALSLPAISWVCEIEASSKVFTGVGGTQNQALGSARANCGSHFQASSCTKSDCRESL